MTILADGVNIEEGARLAVDDGRAVGGEGEEDGRGGSYAVGFGGDDCGRNPGNPEVTGNPEMTANQELTAEAMLVNKQQCSSGTNDGDGGGGGTTVAEQRGYAAKRSFTPRPVDASGKPSSGAKALAAAAAAAVGAVASLPSSAAAAAEADAAAAAGSAVEGGGYGDSGGRRLLSRCDSEDDDIDDDNTTRLGSFRFPDTIVSDDRRGEDSGARAQAWARARGGRNGRAVARNANAVGGGVDDADAGIEVDDDDDGGWEADSEAALTAAETPAAALAPVFEMERAGRAARTLEPVGDDGGLRERRGSMLDAYREPEGHDWDELEDWQGLPGLQAAGIGGMEDIRSRLQVRWWWWWWLCCWWLCYWWWCWRWWWYGDGDDISGFVDAAIVGVLLLLLLLLLLPLLLWLCALFAPPIPPRTNLTHFISVYLFFVRHPRSSSARAQ